MYLVDSNVLIEAKNRYYAFDIAPGFWAWLEHAHNHLLACSIAQVHDELLEGDDELAMWARGHRDFFREVDGLTATHFPSLTQWANSRSYDQAAINEFVGNTADFYLVAYARAYSHTLVTHEKPQPNARRRILIPDVCVAMGVDYADTFAMLRDSDVKLTLQLQT